MELILAVIYQLLLSLRWRGNIDYNDKQGKTNKAAASWSSSSITSQLKASCPGIFTILASGEARRIDHCAINESMNHCATNDKKQDDKVLLLFFCLT